MESPEITWIEMRTQHRFLMVFVHSIAMTSLMQFDFKNLVSYHHRIIEHFSITVYVNFAQTLGRLLTRVIDLIPRNCLRV